MTVIDPNTLDPEQIRKLPMRRDLPYNGLTEEQVRAIGADPVAVEAGRIESNARAEQQAQEEAKQFAIAAGFAVAKGDLTEAEAAQMLLQAGQRHAHDLFVEAWRQEEAEVEMQIATDELSRADAATYLEHLQAADAQRHEQLEAELRQTKDEHATVAIGEMREQLDRFIGSTPGAFERDGDIRMRVGQLIVEAEGVPADEAGKQRMIQQAIRDIAVRDNVTANLVEQVETEWRAHEHRRKADQFTARRSDDRSAAQRAADEAAWKENRLQELASQPGTAVTAARELPPSPEEIAAAEAAKFVEREERSTSFHRQVAGIVERAKEAKSERDHGARITSERQAYRDAVARAEREAMYGSGELKTGYGPNAVQDQPRDVDTPIDEFGGVFPGYSRA